MLLLAVIASAVGVTAGLLTGVLVESGAIAIAFAVCLVIALGLLVAALGRRYLAPRDASAAARAPAPPDAPGGSLPAASLEPPATRAPSDSSAAEHAPTPAPAPPGPPLPPASLVSAGLMPALRQAALAIEKAAEIGQVARPKALLAVGHNAVLRAQEAIGRLCIESAPEPRDAFPIREDIAMGARALAFETGREVALRFASGFPASVIADRAALRLALGTAFHVALGRARGDVEALIEAHHEEGGDARAMARIAISLRGDDTIGPLPPLPRDAPDPLRALGALLATQDGRLFGSADLTQLAFTLPARRQKRMTGTTLYGLGALSDRSALVIDPRAIGRITICELLASWRLTPTGVTTLDDALAAAARALRTGQPFDVVVLSGFGEEQGDRLIELAANLPLLGYAKVVSLESLESLAAPLPSEVERQAGLDLRRLARPPSPAELIETLTALLVRARTDAPQRTSGAGGLTLLVAEDNPVNQALLVKLLERRGHAVTVANNGADLLDRLQEAPAGSYDAILMDIQMPVMDGFEATAVIRLREAQGDRPRIPIIAVTAHAMGGERERCLEAGMDAYLAKPIDDGALAAVLAASAHPARPSAVSAASVSEPFDRRRVLELAAGDVEFLHNLVALFAESAPRLLAEIEGALAAGDAAATHRGAHQLKGSIGNFGAAGAHGVAQALEGAARRGALEECRTLLPELRAALEVLTGALRSLAQEAASVGAPS